MELMGIRIKNAAYRDTRGEKGKARVGMAQDGLRPRKGLARGRCHRESTEGQVKGTVA